jgi:hypothetical protein
MSSALFGYTPAELWEFVNIYWIIPAGMIALYFYGMFHFNTPDYSLLMSDEFCTAFLSSWRGGDGRRSIAR